MFVWPRKINEFYEVMVLANDAFYDYFPVEISMASSGQMSTDDQLQMEPVVRLRRQDMTR
jgi:hypothetical protein